MTLYAEYYPIWFQIGPKKTKQMKFRDLSYVEFLQRQIAVIFSSQFNGLEHVLRVFFSQRFHRNSFNFLPIQANTIIIGIIDIAFYQIHIRQIQLQ